MRYAALLMLCVLAMSPGGAAATAAPNVIIVQGDLLAGPVVLDDWGENLDLMLGLAEPVAEPPFSLDGRRTLEISLFWAVGDYLDAGVEPLELLETDFKLPENHEVAKLYLGRDSEPPVLDYKGFRVVETAAGDILASHGVPLTAAVDRGGGAPAYALAGIVAGLVILGALGFRQWRRQS
jgi:hypothetical protein